MTNVSDQWLSMVHTSVAAWSSDAEDYWSQAVKVTKEDEAIITHRRNSDEYWLAERALYGFRLAPCKHAPCRSSRPLEDEWSVRWTCMWVAL